MEVSLILTIVLPLGRQGPYSPTTLKKVLSLVLQIFVSIETFECYATSDWLKHSVLPIRSCITFKFTNLAEKGEECS